MSRGNAWGLLIRLAFVLALSTGAALVWADEPALGPAPSGSFTIAVIPDTQGYHGRGTKAQPTSTQEVSNAVFEAHTRWIVDNIPSQHIVFVSHVGDIVDINTKDQWRVAQECMNRLHGQVAYGISVGNHDMTVLGDSSLFQETFPASRFAELAWYGGSFEAIPKRPNVSGNNANSYQLLSAEGIDLVLLHLECNAPTDVLQWADGVLEKHSKRMGIVATHMDLGPLRKPTTNQGYRTDPKGRMQWTKRHGTRGSSPQRMWDICFRKHANLALIFSGDQSRTTSMHLSVVGDHGNTVHALLSDYTSSGPLRLYRFLPEEKAIQVITYDTTRGRLVHNTPIAPNSASHEFLIPCAMDAYTSTTEVVLSTQ